MIRLTWVARWRRMPLSCEFSWLPYPSDPTPILRTLHGDTGTPQASSSPRPAFRPRRPLLRVDPGSCRSLLESSPGPARRIRPRLPALRRPAHAGGHPGANPPGDGPALHPRDCCRASSTSSTRPWSWTGPTFASYKESFRQSSSRPAALAGRSYAGDAAGLRAQLGQFFVGPGGAGAPTAARGEPPARGDACVRWCSPHIDFHRGGPVYTWAYKELVERSDADTFVILGVAHQYCRSRFALTRKDFETPLGPSRPTGTTSIGSPRLPARTSSRTSWPTGPSTRSSSRSSSSSTSWRPSAVLDRADPGRLVPRPDGARDRPDRRPRGRAGSSTRCGSPRRSSGKKVAYIGGIDLCHVGPEFGDPEPVDARRSGPGRPLRRRPCSTAPRRATRRAGSGRRPTCRTAGGSAAWPPPTRCSTPSARPGAGLLKYDQAVDDRRTCCVSFASIAFDIPDDSQAPRGSRHRPMSTQTRPIEPVTDDRRRRGRRRRVPPAPPPARLPQRRWPRTTQAAEVGLGRAPLPDDLPRPRARAPR